jgi:hypothetical protein
MSLRGAAGLLRFWPWAAFGGFAILPFVPGTDAAGNGRQFLPRFI